MTYTKRNLCDTCKYDILVCNAANIDFADEVGNDNVIKCDNYSSKYWQDVWEEIKDFFKPPAMAFFIIILVSIILILSGTIGLLIIAKHL